MDQAGRLNYHHLRYFWAVAHAGTLTRAAGLLHVSQSAVSVQVQQLERQLGHPLFERRGKRLVLTEAGRIALDHADAIFAVGEELVDTLDGHDERARTVLRVGALATLSRNFQLDFLAPVLGRADVAIDIRSGALGELIGALESHRIDVLLANVVPAREPGADWVAHALAEQPVGLIGSPRLAATGDELATILAREPLLLPTATSSIRLGFDALVDRLGVRPTVAAEVDDMAMLRLLARERVGLAVVPPIVVKDELETGLLQEVAPLSGLVESFCAITRPRRFPNPLLAALVSAAAGAG
ncbi:MAG: LysR family transcriptional regulator [Planctomycetota bacterium]